jgi:hypothetical protein
LQTSHGAVPVGALTDAARVSGNNLATQFKSHVGVTPKRVARIYRFAQLILSVDALRPVDWYVVSVDGFIADENDDVGPLHDWSFNGDTPIT